MKTYIFIEKNGCAIITIRAKNRDDAWGYLQNLVIDWHGFSLE